MVQIVKKFKSVFVILGIVGTLFLPKVSYAYPVLAQNAYQNPREATGRIVRLCRHRNYKTSWYPKRNCFFSELEQNGGTGRTWTGGLRIFSAALSQLSYSPISMLATTLYSSIVLRTQLASDSVFICISCNNELPFSAISSKESNCSLV